MLLLFITEKLLDERLKASGSNISARQGVKRLTSRSSSFPALRPSTGRPFQGAA